MKREIMLAAVVLLAGCDNKPKTMVVINQELRQQVLKECLQAVPQGPVVTNDNNWSAVVEQCGEQASQIATTIELVDPKNPIDQSYIKYKAAKDIK